MPTWLTVVLALGGSATISTLIGIIGKRIDRNVDKKQAYQQEQERQTRELAEQAAAEIRRKERQAAIVAEIKSVVGPIQEQLTDVLEALSEDKKATVVTLRSSMKTLRDKYLKQGFADAGDKATWNELYENYKDMGGNHFKEYVNQWKSEIENLPYDRK